MLLSFLFHFLSWRGYPPEKGGCTWGHTRRFSQEIKETVINSV